MRSYLAPLVVTAACGCAVDLPFGGGLLTCSSVAECPTGAACVAGYCAPSGSPCVSGAGATAQAVSDGTSCSVKGLSGVCNSGQCAICGDRIVQPGETCDDANADNSDGCTQKCNPPACGDGYLQAGEQCDDGNTSTGDDCLPTCTTNTCGDRSVDPASETCDDGNSNDNDGCGNCQVNAWAASVVVGYGINRAASSYSFFDVEALASDGKGVFIFDGGTGIIWRFDQAASRITPLTRTDLTGGPTIMSEGTIATQSDFGTIGGLAVRNDGDLYIGGSLGPFVDYSDELGSTQPVVLRIDANGVFHNVAGLGPQCDAVDDDDCGNGQLASAAELYQVTALAFNQANDLLIGDFFTLWRVDMTTNIMTRVLGTGYACDLGSGTCGENGDARDAQVSRIGGIVVDSVGGIVVSDSGTGRLLRVDPVTNTVERLPSAGLIFPKGLSRAADGTIYVADRDAHRVFALSPDYRTLTAVAGTSVPCAATDIICGPDSQSALATTLNKPSAVLVDTDGSLLIADSVVNRIRRSTNGTISAGIGTNRSKYNGDGIEGTSLPAGSFTIDAQERVWFGFDNEIVRLNPTTKLAEYVAGSYFANCPSGACGDGGVATNASLGYILDVALDAAGTIYFISLDNQRIRKIDTSGVVSTFAGKDASCDGTTNCGTATTDPKQAIFSALQKIEVIGDALYTLESIDDTRAVVRKIGLSTGTIAIIAGANALGDTNTAQPASQARFSCPFDLAAGPNGSVLIADTLNCAVRQITGDTVIANVATGSTCTHSTDCAWDATDPSFYGDFIPTSVATDAQGNILVYDQNAHEIIRYSDSGATPIMGDGSDTGPLFGVAAAQASFTPDVSAYDNGQSFDIVRGMQVDASGNLYLYEYPDFVVVKLDTSGFVSPVLVDTDDVASGSTDKGKLFAARAFGHVGADMLISDDTLVRRLTLQMSIIETVMGNEDGANETYDDRARYHAPIGASWGLAVDATGNRAFIGDAASNQIFVLGTNGDALSWTFDAYSQSTASGYRDGALASAQFNAPRGLAYDALNKRLYVADAGNHVVRSIDDGSRTVSTIAGSPRVANFAGDGGPANAAKLDNPSAIAVASDGSIYIADTNNNRVRRVAADGTISTVLGDGVAANVASPASSTGSVAAPRGLRFDTFGNLWVTAGRAVHVVVGDTTAPPDGTTASLLAYATTPKDDFPASVIGCLVDVDTGNDPDSMFLLDGCQGLVLKLTRQ